MSNTSKRKNTQIRKSRTKRIRVIRTSSDRSVITESTRGTDQWIGWQTDQSNLFDKNGHSSIRPPVRRCPKKLNDALMCTLPINDL